MSEAIQDTDIQDVKPPAPLTPFQKMVLLAQLTGRGGFRRPKVVGQKKRNRRAKPALLARVTIAAPTATEDSVTFHGGRIYDIFTDGSLRRRDVKVRGKAVVKAQKRERR